MIGIRAIAVIPGESTNDKSPGRCSHTASFRVGGRFVSLPWWPHFFSYKPSHQIAKTIFDPIVKQDINQQLIPGLAESWRLVDDNTWEFKLRKGVVWHDGTPFTADDIVFTAERSEAGIPGSPTTPTRFFLLGGKKYKKIDDYTVHVVTPEPYALMAADLSLPVVVGRKNGTGAGGKPMDSKDYYSG